MVAISLMKVGSMAARSATVRLGVHCLLIMSGNKSRPSARLGSVKSERRITLGGLKGNLPSR